MTAITSLISPLMIYLYQAIFYRPILNVLVYFYETIAGRDFGIAIILSHASHTARPLSIVS